MKKIVKVSVTARIPLYVKEYCKQNKITISQLCMRGFDDYRSTDKDHALNRLDYHEKRVLHWKGIVLHHDQECNTKHRICNTIRKEFQRNGRGHTDTKREDMNWVRAKCEKLIDEGIIIKDRELYEFCKRKE